MRDYFLALRDSCRDSGRDWFPILFFSARVYIPRMRRERTIVAVLYFHFMTLNSTGPKVNVPGKSTFAEEFFYSFNQSQAQK